jgi:glycosyltransferase involved in cell wall biosynthesis
MPNTLVEAMASGLPIACSDRGPMPEILKDAGVYFDPENHESISTAVFELLRSHELRKKLAERAYQLSTQYSWARCARETWSYLSDTWAAHQSERK